MGVPFADADKALESAAKELFKNDPRVRSVGIGRHGNGYGFHVIRNTAQVFPLAGALGPPPLAIQKVPVTFYDRRAEVERHLKVPHTGPGSPGMASLVPEQKRHNPLVCGLQIQNYDDDVRTGTI